MTSGYAGPSSSIPLSFVNMFVQQQPYQMLEDEKEVNHSMQSIYLEFTFFK